MRSTASSVFWVAVAQCLVPIAAQTFTKCNPLQVSCPADPALGKSISIDLTQGASDQFSAQGVPTYDSQGGAFTVAKSGDSPTIISNWYMMFGKVEVVLKAAPGVGIVSTMVLQSDDLDEIDWEWLGADDTQVQSNYFGKGDTSVYNRGGVHPNPGNQDGFHTYGVEFTADQIVWSIDGNNVRVLTPATADPGQYPQTPMQLKIGIWSAGDAANPPGTISWAGGQTNYANGPFTMHVQSITATDYSTGTQYSYGDMSGDWTSIKSTGGTIGGAEGSSASAPVASAPSVTSVASGAPSPFDGTHRDTSSTFSTPSIWPWVASATTMQTTTATETTIPGLPSGWTVSTSGKVIPPSAAPTTSPPASFTSSSVALPLASGGFNAGSNVTGTPSTSSTAPIISTGAGNTKLPLSGLGAVVGIFAGALIL